MMVAKHFDEPTTIPAGWSLSKVSEICRLQNGHGFRPHEWAESGYPIIRIQNLNGNQKFNFYSGPLDERWLVRPGQMLFAWAGTKGASFGPTVWGGPVGVLNQHIFKVFPRQGIDGGWLYCALRHVTDRIEARAHGFKATLVHVKKSEIDDHDILVPPLREQQRIAEIISTWDRAIETETALVVAARAENAALMQKLLTGNRRLGGFTEEWAHRSVGQISTRVTRRNDSLDLPVLTISSTSGFVRQDQKYRRYMAGKSVESYIVLERGAFAYNKGNSKTYEYGCVFPLESYDVGLVPHVYVCFKLKAGYSHRFYKALFSADYLNPQLGRLVNTGVRNNGLLNITPGQFLATTLPVPPLSEQEAIAEIMETAAAALRVMEQKLVALRDERVALMQQLLTGRRRVVLPESEAA
jgi:type I restriction enzyme S subunit